VLDHIFITVNNPDESISFYEQALAPLGIRHVLEYDGADGPESHPDLKGFGRDGRVSFWLRQGRSDASSAHVGFVANCVAEVNLFYEAALAAGATYKSSSGACLHDDPRYCAANIFDPDGYSIEVLYKNWQHLVP
jgi:catechol 2,3-dioxygenase-like lactoylglutathione lyase family enzyme